jgi:hypothetical protein
LPGRTPREAVDAFLEPLRDILSCVAQAKICLSHDGYGRMGRTHALTVNNDTPVPLKCSQPRLSLKIAMHYEIVHTEDRPERGRYRVSTRGYMYEMQTDSGELVWSYHWHPNSKIAYPHQHIGHTQLAPDAVLLYKAHYPSGRVSLESVIHTCLAEYGVSALRDDWREVLDRRETDFQEFRSWS